MFNNIDLFESELNKLAERELDSIFNKIERAKIVDYESFKNYLITSYSNYASRINNYLIEYIKSDGFSPNDIINIDDFGVKKGTYIIDVYKHKIRKSYESYHLSFLERFQGLKGLSLSQKKQLHQILDNNQESQSH
jgi:hypothetical protein